VKRARDVPKSIQGHQKSLASSRDSADSRNLTSKSLNRDGLRNVKNTLPTANNSYIILGNDPDALNSDSPLTKLSNSRYIKQSNGKKSVGNGNIFEKGSARTIASASVSQSRSFFHPAEVGQQEELLLEKDFQTLGRNAKLEVAPATRKEDVKISNSKSRMKNVLPGNSQEKKITCKKQQLSKPLNILSGADQLTQTVSATDDEDYQLARTSTNKKRIGLGSEVKNPQATAHSASLKMKQNQASYLRKSHINHHQSLRESTAVLKELYANRNQGKNPSK